MWKIQAKMWVGPVFWPTRYTNRANIKKRLSSRKIWLKMIQKTDVTKKLLLSSIQWAGFVFHIQRGSIKTEPSCKVCFALISDCVSLFYFDYIYRGSLHQYTYSINIFINFFYKYMAKFVWTIWHNSAVVHFSSSYTPTTTEATTRPIWFVNSSD